MTPISLTIEHFGSVPEKVSFEFPTKPGLYFLSGKNGAGKSTLWKALTWVFFGKDAKGLKAGDVANWKEPKGARVAFTFDWMNVLYEVTRTHAPNSWTLRHADIEGGAVVDLTTDETNPVLEMLRLDYTMWLNTVVLAQDEPMFLDLKPDAKSALFAEVMGLSKWDEYASNASKLSSESDVIARKLEGEAARFGGILEGLEAIAAELPEKERLWEDGRRAARESLAEQYEHLMKDRPRLQEALTAADTESSVCQMERSARLKFIDEIAAPEEAAVEAQLRAVVKEDAINGNEYARAAQHAGELNSLDVCPTCGTADVLALGEAAKREQKRADKLKITMQASEDKLAGIEAMLKIKRESLADAQDRAKKALTALDMAGDTLRAARVALEANTRMLDRLEEQADDLAKQINPHTRAADTSTADRDRVRRQHRDVLRELGESTERAALMGFWVRGFKELRLQLIAEALDQLALEVGNCIAAVGLVGWVLTFEVDRETKKGTIARGFNVFVKSPKNDRQVPWESWSGGEAQRLRVATQEGLANLIRSSTGASIALEVWDEPSHGMEAEGLADLLEALRERAHAEKRQIWVTDHHALGSAAFDGTVLVKMTRRGSEYGAIE